jgi:transposase-like protein
MTREDVSRVDELLQVIFQDKLSLKDFLGIMLEKVMEAEVSGHLHAGRYERTECRRGQRNGVKPRSLKTRVGEMSLSVPQVRGMEPYHPTMFARWQRSERALLVACAEMYIQGVSTRGVKDVLEEMCGLEISSGTVSRVSADLDEKLGEFRDRRLDGHEYPYLLVDACYIKVRKNGRVVSQAVLIVVGINEEGYREVLDWRVGDSESESTWSEVFRSLKDRGLRGVRLVVSDGHEGIKAALSRHMQGVEWQRCRVHFMRELMKKLSWSDWKELMEDIKGVFCPEERKECLLRGEEMAAKWEKRGAKKVAKMLREGLEDCLTVCSLPSSFRRKLHSTNMVERLIGEVKQRTKVVGVFPSGSSCERLVGAVLVEVDDKWRLGKCYLNMELLEEPLLKSEPVDTKRVG